LNVGEQLRLMRKNVGLTQESVAEIMNITRQTLSNWERGINLPDIYTVARLATVYMKFSSGKHFLREDKT